MYRVVVFADGTVVFDGQHYVRESGVARTKVDPAEVVKLVQRFDAIGYFTLANQYGVADTVGCGAVLADAPLTTTSIVSGTRAKSVMHHHRCQSEGLRQLTDLENQIDRLAKTVRWIK